MSKLVLAIALLAVMFAQASNAAEWEPSESDKAAVESLLRDYLEALHEERFAAAYGMLTPGMKKILTFGRWKALEQSFLASAGGEPEHSNIRVTWYKDPAHAALPGVYAAFDLSCKYKNISICSEVIILHREESGNFLVMRHEKNYVDKENERRIRDLQRH